MSRLVVAELLKVRTTRAWIGFLLALIVLTGIAAAGTVGGASDIELGTTQLSRDIVASSLIAALVALLVGIVSVTSEWRHGTVTRTFLATPRRERVLVAKEIWMVVLAASMAVLAMLVVLAVALPWLAFEGSWMEVDRHVAGLAGRVVLAVVAWGLLGVGIGAVVQSQTPALVGSILWVLLGEALIAALLGLGDLESVADYLPGRALSSLDGTEDGRLSTWVGGGVALAWITALGVFGGFRMHRQDVT